MSRDRGRLPDVRSQPLVRGRQQEFRERHMRQGPLTGLRIIEFAGIGPGPFCGMLLSDLGADVVRIDRKTSQFSIGIRGTKFAVTETCLRLAEGADAIFEGFRPGVMERLGLGPAMMLQRNPALVYGRMSGW